MDTVLQDLRYAIRGLARAPGFAAIVLMTMAIGTGANATVFSFINALLIRPAVAVPEADTLVSVYTADFSSGPFGLTSYPDYLSLKQEATAFESLAAYADGGMSVLRRGQTIERVRSARVTGDFFAVLKLQPTAGRLLGPGDLEGNASPAAVISADVWQRAFGSSAAVIGSQADVGGTPVTIVGVAPSRFNGLDLGRAYDVWLPQAPVIDAGARGSRAFSVIGRLRTDITLEQAQAQVAAVALRLAAAYPDTNRGTLQQPDAARPIHVRHHTRLPPAFRAEVTVFSGVMLAAVILVLLIACANVSALLLSRATARVREIAVRLALGASRRRLVRQLMIESLLLGCIGGGLGLLFALWTADVLPSFFPEAQARILDARVDLRVIAFTAAVAVLSSLVFGLAPALQSTRGATTAALRGDAARTGDRRGLRLRRTLVMAQVALAVVLLSSAAVLVRSLSDVLNADRGFSTRDAVIASIDIPGTLAPPEAGAYVSRLLEAVRTTPGVRSAALTLSLPFGGGPRRGFDLEGYQRRTGEGRELNFNIVTPDYFETMGIALVSGRLFSTHDRAESERVAIVNEPLARRYFGGRAIGRSLRDARGTTLRIVGVVGPGAPRDVHEPAPPTVFYALAQEPRPRLAMVARAEGDASTLVDTVRRRALEADPRVPVFRVMTLQSLLVEALTTDRLVASLVSASATLALVLAVIGLYGVISYGVARRAREIGVRVALGATARDVIRIVVGEGVAVTMAGVAIGLLATLFATRALQAALAGVGAAGAVTYVAVPILLMATAVVAAIVPAARALALEPTHVLRTD